jgi:hypothetical protein
MAENLQYMAELIAWEDIPGASLAYELILLK